MKDKLEKSVTAQCGESLVCMPSTERSSLSLESTPLISSSPSFWYQFLHSQLTYSFTHHFFLFWFTTLLIHNSLSLFHARLKTYLFHKSYSRSFTSSSTTAVTDFCPDRFFWANRFLFLVLPYIFVSVPCARLSWPYRQLLNACKYIVSYRIISYQKPSSLRSGNTTNYCLPRLRTIFGERAFSYAGPAAWNRLPQNIRASTSLNVFLNGSWRHIYLQKLLTNPINMLLF